MDRVRRISKDSYYYLLAESISKRSTCLRRHYGAVIVNNDQVIATGYNGAPRGDSNCCDIGECNRDIKGLPQWSGYEECCAVHAEMNAIISASRKEMLGGYIYLYGYDMMKKEEIQNPHPCSICEKLIKNAGLTVRSLDNGTY